MANPRPDEKNPTQASQDAARRMSEETSRVARAAADAGERVAHAGVDIMQRNAEAARQVWQSGSDMATRLTERSADQFARVLGLSGEEAQRAARQSSQNIEAIVQSSTILADGIQNISREWLDFARNRMEHSLDQLNALSRCRNPQDLVAIQSNLVRDNMEGMLQSTHKIAEVLLRTADEATRKMSENADRMRRVA